MKRHWTCSRCRIACPSTWLSLKPPNAVVCNACRSKGAKSNCVLNPHRPKQLSEDEGAKVNINVAEIITPTSHENVAFSVDPKVKSEVFTADTEVDHHFYRGKSLKPPTTSTLGDSSSTIKIKQEQESEESEPIWYGQKVQKKKRSKLPQYTLSPLVRFINRLQRASGHRRLRLRIGPKYDDVLIYEKCIYVAENEIGLGAELLPPVFDWTKSTLVIKEEEQSSSTN